MYVSKCTARELNAIKNLIEAVWYGTVRLTSDGQINGRNHCAVSNNPSWFVCRYNSTEADGLWWSQR